jgi:hypothetical protein
MPLGRQPTASPAIRCLDVLIGHKHRKDYRFLHGRFGWTGLVENSSGYRRKVDLFQQSRFGRV